MSDKGYKISLTLKGSGGYDHPWLVFYGDTTEEIQDQLEQAHAKDLFTAVGRAHASYKRGAEMGAKLDATTIKVEKAEEKPKATKKASTESRPAPSKDAAEAEQAPKAEAPAEEPKTTPKPPSGAPKPAWMRS